MKTKRPQNGLTQMRNVPLAIKEINEDERRVSVSFSSEVAVQRWYGQEILCHDEECIDFTRLNEIGVSLFNHDRNKVIGRIENAICNNDEKRAYCDIVFDEDEESEKIYQKVKSGTLKGVSVGYSVSCWEEVRAGATSSNGRFQGPCEVATKWEPYEVSIASVPADSSVGVGRDLDDTDTEKSADIENEEDKEMKFGRNAFTPNMAPHSDNGGATAQSTIDEAQVREAAIIAERERSKTVTELCINANERGLSLDTQKFIQEGLSVDQVREKIVEALVKHNGPLGQSREDGEVKVQMDEADKLRSAASDAILMRAGRSVEKPAEGAVEMRGMRLRDLAIECLQRAGVVNAQRLSPDELFKRALTPDGQFGAILSDSVNKSMSTAYKSAPLTYKQWTGKGSNPDFKGATHYQISEAGELEKMTQTGEFKFDEMKDQGVSKSIATFGKEFGITRVALINDDLSVLTRIPEAYVRAAGRGINNLVYKMLTSNPIIFDNRQLFHDGHGNLAVAGEGINIASLSAGRAAMRKQKNLRGKETLNISPRYLIVGPDKETEAEQMINSIVDPSRNNQVVNPFNNKLEVICDANIDGNAWFLAADQMDCDGIEVTYLNGNEMPQLESQIGFDYLGIKWRIFMDYGVNILDYRGLYKNAGN